MSCSDVIHPSLEAPLAYPDFYNYTYVHFLPGGYLNSQTIRISFLGNSKFTFLDETKLNEWLVKLYKTQQDSIDPQVILDIGTGTGGSAFVLGQLFPQAHVLGIDLAPAYIRFNRAHKEIRQAENVDFYQANAENLEFIESDSIDFINFAYVLHEMPADNAKAIVREMFRVLKPGGVVNGFEVPYKRNSIVRDYFVSSNTWDEDWHVQVGNLDCKIDWRRIHFFFFLSRAIKDQNHILENMNTMYNCLYTWKKLDLKKWMNMLIVTLRAFLQQPNKSKIQATSASPNPIQTPLSSLKKDVEKCLKKKFHGRIDAPFVDIKKEF